MSNILPQAQVLVNLLLSLMPSYHKTPSLPALLGLFLQAQGSPLPQSCQAKSPAALSRFLNRYDWPTRTLIRQVRSHLVQTLLSHCPRGRRPHLQLIIDLTCLPKRGRFKAFSSLIRVFHRKRGLHLVILYIVVGHWRLPWGFRVYRGKGTPSPAQLGLRLLRTLPKALSNHFRLMVLADAGFGSLTFLEGVHRLRMHAFVLAHWGYLLMNSPETLDWGMAARQALELLFPALVASLILQELERLRSLLLSQGINTSVTYCKI